MRHTICGRAGHRIIVEPSKTSLGNVSFTVLSADRVHVVAFTLDPSSAQVLADSLGESASQCEAVHQLGVL